MSFTRASYSQELLLAERQAATERLRALEAEKPKMSLLRLLGTAASISLGLAVCFSGLHYIPTLLKPTQIVDTVSSPGERSLLDIDRNRIKDVGIYAQSFLLRRTYLRAGQGLSVHYNLPENTTLDLTIKQCRRMFVIEVFRCDIVTEKTVRVEGRTNGSRTLRFSQPGFYHFDETLTLADPDDKYRLVWVRS